MNRTETTEMGRLPGAAHKRLFGRCAERRAAAYLCAQGYQLVEANYRARRNEIDLIARDGGTLCFVEVKSRSAAGFGRGCEAVDWRKQQAIRRAAAQYLLARGLDLLATPCRFDVVSVDAGQITLYKNAF